MPSFRTPPLDRTSTRVEPDDALWLGDQVIVDGEDGDVSDGTVVDVLLSDGGDDLTYTVRTDGGRILNVASGSIRVKCLAGIRDDAAKNQDESGTVSFPLTAETIAWLHGYLDADKALMCDLLRSFAETLMWAETERTPDRIDYRQGYRPRVLNTDIGKVRLLMPRVGQGTYFPTWLFDRPVLADRVLLPFVRPEFLKIVRHSYIDGVSSERLLGIVHELGITRISESQLTSVAKALNDAVEAGRKRPLQAKVRPVVRLNVLEADGVACVVVTGGTAVHQEMLDVAVMSMEGHGEWVALLQSLIAQGLHGVKTVISDHHEGLQEALAVALPWASWRPAP